MESHVEFCTCTSCGLIRKIEVKKYNGCESNWGKNYLSTYENGMSWRNIISNSRCSLIESIINAEINHLDLGGANGGFSKIMSSRGHNSSNFEPDATFRQASRNNGVKTLEKLDEATNKGYNVITSYDSLGYSVNLKKDLRLIYEKLNENSIFWGTFGYVDYGLENSPDLSFNYYFKQKTVSLLSSILGKGGRCMQWVEDRSFNLEESRLSDKYWVSKLKLTDEPKVTNLIILKGMWSDIIPAKAYNFWNFC